MNNKKINNFGQGLGNYGKLLADTSLSALGMSNVIDEDNYKGNSAEFFNNASNITGQIAQVAAPMVANAIIPGSGTIIKGVQSVGNVANGMFPMGGNINGVTAELEKQEVFQTPEGFVGQVNGPTHNNGGVPVNVPNNTRVFSDRLKASSGLTFAKEAEKFKTEKWEKILNNKEGDTFSKNAAKKMLEVTNRKLDSLFNEQEEFKAKNGLTDEGKKLPNGGKVNDTLATNVNLETAKDTVKYNYPLYGQRVVNGQYQFFKGYVNDTADNFKALNRNSPIPGNPIAISEEEYAKAVKESPYNVVYGHSGDVKTTPEQLYFPSKAYGGKIKKMENGGDFNFFEQTEEQSNPFSNPSTNINDPNTSNIDPNFLIASAGNFIGPMADILRGAKGGDTVNFERVNPDNVSYEQARKLNTEQYNTGFQSTKKAIQQGTNGNAGSYLANVQNAAYLRDKSIGQFNTQSFENEANTNAQLNNQAKYFNAQTQQQESVANQQEKDIASNTLTTGLYNLGAATSQVGKDLSMKANDPIIRSLIATNDYKYQYDPKGKPIGIIHIGTGKLTKFE